MRNNILFDLDGTLTDPGEGITNSVRFALDEMGFDYSGLDLTRFIGPPLDEGFSEYCGFDNKKVEQAALLFRNYFKQHGIHQNQLFEGIPELLAELTTKGRKLHLATSKPQVFAEQILKTFGLAEYFSFFTGSPIDHLGTAKAEIVRQALDKANIAPETAIMVGDRKHDVLGAQKNGIPSIGVLYGYGDRAEHQQAGASYIAVDIPQLRQILLDPNL